MNANQSLSCDDPNWEEKLVEAFTSRVNLRLNHVSEEMFATIHGLARAAGSEYCYDIHSLRDRHEVTLQWAGQDWHT